MDWTISEISTLMPFAYILSGGVSFRPILPGWSYQSVRWLEKYLGLNNWGMFAVIKLVKSKLMSD